MTDDSKCGIIKVTLETQADRNNYTDVYYIYAATLSSGPRSVNRILPDGYNDYVGNIELSAATDDCSQVSVESKYGDALLSLDGTRSFSTGRIGLSYASCEIFIRLMPDDDMLLTDDDDMPLTDDDDDDDMQPTDDDGRYDAWS